MSRRLLYRINSGLFARMALSAVFLFGGLTSAWLNLQTQQEQIQLNLAGVEVMGSISFKRQTLQSSGRSTQWVNTFNVSYFDKPTTAEDDPIVFDAFGKQITLSDGQSAIGDFYSYDIHNIPDTIYEQATEGERLALIYLPEAPEKVWLKSMIKVKTEPDFRGPISFALIGLLLAVIPLVPWSGRFS